MTNLTMFHPVNLPVGTQVVIRCPLNDRSGKIAHPRGAVGVIVKIIDENIYQIRFVDGFEAVVHQQYLRARKHFQKDGLNPAFKPEFNNLLDHVIYRCIVGSRAYGLEVAESDIDRRGIYLAPADRHWSIYGVPEQLENQDTQECYWELQKFIIMALKANPNILECLYTPLTELVTPMARELLNQKEIFLSKLVYQTFNGYVLSQFSKLNRHIKNHGQIKWKHAMHLLRLLLSGITILRQGFVPVRVDNHREQLLAIRRGEMDWSEVEAWRLGLHKEFDAAFATTRLPEQPDYAAADEFLIKARRSMVKS